MTRIVLVAVAALTLAGAAWAEGGGVVASASGGYRFSGEAAGSHFDVGPFTFNVKLFADGTAQGRFNYTHVRDGGSPLTVKGSLTCAVIVDGHAWVGGVIEQSTRETLVGLDMWFQVHDTGEPGSDETPDMSSSIGAGPPGTGQQYCDDAPTVRFPFFITEGNIQVRSG